MKKLITGTLIEKRQAKCSFCGENNKQCFKGTVPFICEYREPITEMVKVVENVDFVSVTFGKSYYKCSDYKYDYVIKDYKKVKEEDNADICKDCIKQLAKLI